ncbi:flagellar export chaperone FliS [Candidatus Acetatifactor stercoripullorum]|uniref:flagellar export chaperone FliS n=1 Tax=Candidatus Acetatifactor stercoripullorum TaxID=2838414 RepID=UPI00298E3759|nr:flagellar protein FliS [Candidatus Acetatifactor stercoripullorum]
MTKEQKQEFTRRITQANSTQLIVILYEMLLLYLEEGAQAHASGDRDAFREAIRKARGCLNELLASLNPNYEPAPALLRLYLFCIRRLAYGEVRNDPKVLEEIEKVIRPLHDAYEKIAPQNENGPVMNNSQAVYAGLTYGRNTLTENMADQGANRGMLV